MGVDQEISDSFQVRHSTDLCFFVGFFFFFLLQTLVPCHFNPLLQKYGPAEESLYSVKS